MKAHADHPNDHEPGPPGRLPRAGAIAIGLMAICLLVAACSVPGQPQAQPSSGSSRASALAYSRCMRSHGVPDFPDPDSQGGITVNHVNQGSGLDPASPQFQAADKACKSLMPPGQKPTQRDREQLLKYAQCMRAHGISDFPDPKDGNGAINVGKQGSDLTPDNPQFQAADKACKQFMPGGPGGGTVHSQQG